jgi:hypothetical protein
MQHFSPTWFDWVAVILPVFGAWRGGRRGLSEELPLLVQWSSILGLGALGAPMLGQGLARVTGMTPALAVALSYLGLAGALKLVFLALTQLLSARQQLLHFGSWEHFLGGLAGTFRYAAMVVFGLALACGLDTSNLRQELARPNRGETFEALCAEVLVTLQEDIVDRSFIGVWARRDLDRLLLKPLPVATGARPSAAGSGRPPH